jgi:peroxiredoxin Q/BCP
MRVAIALLASLLIATSAAALEVGDQAPDFSLADQNGKTVRLSDLRGKSNAVIAFYVMAFTPG